MRIVQPIATGAKRKKAKMKTYYNGQEIKLLAVDSDPMAPALAYYVSNPDQEVWLLISDIVIAK